MSAFLGVVREMDPEHLRHQARTALPFPHILVDNFLETDFAHAVANSWPSYEQAMMIGTKFRSINERNKVQVTNSSDFPQPLKVLNQALASSAFAETISSVFGIPDLLPDAELVGGGLHQTGPRGRLDVHVDFNYIEARKLHRRLNILIYFNEGWLPEWGGQVELWNQDVTQRIQSFDPVFNRCVIFETSQISFHGVTEVTCPPDVVRRSFAGYYYTEAPPVHWTGESHSTIFKARPTETAKGGAMAAKRASHVVKETLKHSIGKSPALTRIVKAVRSKK